MSGEHTTQDDDGTRVPSDPAGPVATPTPQEEPDAGTLAEGGAPETPAPASDEERVPKSRLDQTIAERWAERRAREQAEARAALAEESLRQFQELALGKTETPPAPGGDTARAPTSVDPHELARGIAAEQRFNESCNEVAARGKAAHEDFDARLAALRTMAGGQLPRAFVETALATGQAEDVIYELGKDTERADRILQMSPLQAAMEMTRLVDSLGKPPAREVSRAPAPIKPAVGGNGAQGAKDLRKIPMEEFIAIRDAQEAERAKRGLRR